MKEDEKLEEHLNAIRGLGLWRQENEVSPILLVHRQERENEKIIHWMVAASLTALLFSGFFIAMHLIREQKIAQQRFEQIAILYTVPNLTY
jgi:Ni,Fe-hydrogenase I cytochrome b subunit